MLLELETELRLLIANQLPIYRKFIEKQQYTEFHLEKQQSSQIENKIAKTNNFVRNYGNFSFKLQIKLIYYNRVLILGDKFYVKS